MKLFSVWSEGYAATGEQSKAIYHGKWKGKTFADACEAWAKYTGQFSYFNKSSLTYWGCKLYDNGTDARKHFG